ncbi:MAG: hypothetical protein FWE95_02070 [Planctomycetaceae bacterium]|nr:hypothetical protein [Planctomycetaceae bacterium]
MSQIEPEQPQKERLPHSICGVVSFRFAVGSLVLFCILFSINLYLTVTFPETFKNPDTWYQEEPLLFIFLNSGIWGCLLAALAAFILGIAGVHQPRTRKVFSVLGMFISMYPFILIPVFANIIRALGGGCC